ncbi:TonB-dependent receptor [Phenylobacterium sp. J367]|uniref:TonB-dependent receptor n=1 Tax=Phenylobacterium sp. J367 TaxID=2898435 RepID=UPI002150F321|nr:TonB-dependent receptor [Phenylobacterium sp. J367]MCR5880920.1 TonB-dependent receptor [Phenylobacterium sp. J367]
MLSELVVTATKRARNPRELAVAVSAASGDALEDSGATDIADAAPQLAGVLATNLGPGRNKLLLRGLSDGAFTGRTRSTVVTYLDDVPLNYNAPDPDLRLVDVERVEVARGPQGALYGAGSLAGVYRIVSRRPDLDAIQAEVRGTVADTKDGDPSHAIQGYVSLPLWRDTAGLRVSGYNEVQGGQLDDINLGRDDVDRTERRGGRASLLFEPTDAFSVMIAGAGQHLRSDDTHYTNPGMGLKRANRIAEPHVNDIALGSATIKGSWRGFDFTSSSGYVRHAYGSFYDATLVQDTYTDFRQTSAYSERTKTKLFVQDMFVVYDGRKFEWLFGVYGSAMSAHSPTEFLAQGVVGNQPVEVMVYADDRRDRIREYAAYGELTYQPAPGWTLALGGRVFTTRTRTSSDVVSERFEPRSLDAKQDFTGVSPKVSLQYELPRGDLIYGVISEGHRAGGFNSGGAEPIRPAVLAVYDPDRLRHFEVGAKLTFGEGRLGLNSAVFFDDWRNIQTDQFRFDSVGIPFTTNAGSARILGLEGELAYRWTPNLLIQANARVARTRTYDPNLDAYQELGEGLPGAPGVLRRGDDQLREAHRRRLAAAPHRRDRLCRPLPARMARHQQPEDGRLCPHPAAGRAVAPEFRRPGLRDQSDERLWRHLRLRQPVQSEPDAPGHAAAAADLRHDVLRDLLKIFLAPT